MVYYSSSRNRDILDLINKFCSLANSKSIHLSNVKNIIPDRKNVFFLPVYGEEELSNEWEKFLKKYAKKSYNIGIDTFFYLYGVYDLEINKNTTIVLQINNILKFLSAQINIFPLKIMSNYTSVESLVYYYNHTNVSIKKSNNNFLVNKIIFYSKCELLQNDIKVINFTNKSDGYSSVIDKIKLKHKKKKKNLIKTLSSLYCESIILNRVKSIKIDKVLKKTKNNKILKLQLKSNKLKNDKVYLNFSSLKVLNLTANLFNTINIEYLPISLEVLNVSKNRIKKILINNNRLSIKKLILFNNKISDMNFLNKLPNITYLNIGLNPIKNFPNAILNLKKLEHLNLSFLKIDKIPDEILKLNNLKTIDLTGTKINNNKVLEKLLSKNIKIIS